MTERAPVTYREAGVDIDAGEELVERIKPGVKRSMRREVLGGIGGFGALVEVPLDRYRKPVLVSGTDGVGTKLRLAIDTGRHDTVGIDLVAMCVNDVVVQGAEPLFFLDYFATGKLVVDIGLDGVSLGDRLMAPTRIYVKALLKLVGTLPVHGLSHITGGGLVDNIPRVIPDGLEVILERRAWCREPVFEWLQDAGRVADQEMYRVFNCGIGMTIQVAAKDADRAVSILREAGQEAVVIGEVKSGTRGVVI